MNGRDTVEKEQRIYIDNRKRITVTGVTDTDKFDESSVLLYTALGELLIKGHDLHVNALSLESGEMTVEGEIGSVIYGDSAVKGPLGFLQRLIK